MGGTVRKSRVREVPLSDAEDDELERRLLNDPHFLKRIESAPKSVRAGRGIRLEDVEW
jgi:hypothetical protein